MKRLSAVFLYKLRYYGMSRDCRLYDGNKQHNDEDCVMYRKIRTLYIVNKDPLKKAWGKYKIPAANVPSHHNGVLALEEKIKRRLELVESDCSSCKIMQTKFQMIF